MPLPGSHQRARATTPDHVGSLALRFSLRCEGSTACPPTPPRLLSCPPQRRSHGVQPVILNSSFVILHSEVSMSHGLGAQPRVRLINLPTPLQEAPRLREALGGAAR